MNVIMKVVKIILYVVVGVIVTALSPIIAPIVFTGAVIKLEKGEKNILQFNKGK